MCAPCSARREYMHAGGLGSDNVKMRQSLWKIRALTELIPCRCIQCPNANTTTTKLSAFIYGLHCCHQSSITVTHIRLQGHVVKNGFLATPYGTGQAIRASFIETRRSPRRTWSSSNSLPPLLSPYRFTQAATLVGVAEQRLI